MKLYILNLGKVEVKGTTILANSTLPRVAVPSWAALIQTDDGRYILYDVGCDNDPAALGTMKWIHTEEETIKGQLNLLGLTFDDISLVILSHLHYDHCGSIGHFRHKPIYVPDYGWAKDAPIPLILTGCCFQKIDKDFDLDKNIRVICLPGHTPNLLGLQITLSSGSYLLPSDAIYTPENEVVPPAHCSSLDNYFASHQKLKGIQEKYHSTILYPHSSEAFDNMRKAPDFYW